MEYDKKGKRIENEIKTLELNNMMIKCWHDIGMQKLIGLDLFRIVAAVIVFCFHSIIEQKYMGKVRL